MKTTITKGLTGQAKEEMILSFNACGNFRERLELILKEKQESARKANMQESMYENPNWALKQADLIGFTRALEEVISLLK